MSGDASGTKGFEIRALAADEGLRHVDALAEILADCVAGGASVSFLLPCSAEDARSFWIGEAERAARGERVVLVAGDAAGLAGTVELVPVWQPNQPHRAEIAKLLVHRRSRGRGVGRALMQRAEREALRRGRTLLTLDTVPGDTAERLYLALGYTRAGIIPDYAMWPDGRLCDTAIFWKRL
jgi:GNAT superfamily N-acetyltransferase